MMMRGGRVDHGGRQITLMGNGVLLGAPAAKQGSWEEWRKKHEWKWEEQVSGQGRRVQVTLRVGVWTAWKGVEGLGAGSKKWQFQFPGTYNTDAKEGTLALRKGGEKGKRGRRKTRRGRRRMRKGKEKEDKKEKGEKEEEKEERRDTRRDIGASSPSCYLRLCNTLLKQMQTLTIIYYIIISAILLIFLYGGQKSLAWEKQY